jgi:hypothetical protein
VMRRLQNPPSPTNMVSIVSKNGIASQSLNQIEPQTSKFRHPIIDNEY